MKTRAALGRPYFMSFVVCGRYRVRDYRVICDIREQTGVVFVLAIKHRSSAYD